MPTPRSPSTPDAGESAADPGVTRRAALQTLAGSLGVVLTGQAGEAADRQTPHAAAAHIAERPQQTANTAPAAFLDSHQFATLTVIADLIVPGAAASGSPRYIDDVLAIERHDVQQRFAGALAAIDAAARERHERPFRDLARDRQIALLESAFAEPSPVASRSAMPVDPVERPSAAPPLIPLRDPVDHLKTWIAGAHYSSESGMKELGWTGEVVFTSFPACAHADGHE